MNAEIVAVGTELLLGQIVNTNAARLSEALATVGIDVYRHVTVGDNLDRMTAAISDALDRADVVIVTGGLGPTPDDITREAIAAATGRALVRDPELVARIASVFARLGREMPDSNLRQADLPEGAIPVGPEGTAPGFMLEHDGRLLVALPGVPWEMEAMLERVVIPDLAARFGAAALVSRQVLVMGLGESATHAKIADIVEAQTNPTIAYLAGGGQVRLRLTAKASTEADARALIVPVEAAIRARLGDDAVPGSHDSIAAALGDMLRARRLTVAVAESLTGGMIGAALTAAPGASDYFVGSLVCYSKAAKQLVAGLPAELLAQGMVTAEVAAGLARAAVERFGADLGVSATGVAGPDGFEGKPAGTIFVGATFKEGVETRHVRGYGDRANMRAIAANAAIDLGRRMLGGE